MENHIKIRLQKQPPKWSVGDQDSFCSYFENQHGEQWVAKLDENTQHVSGLDLGWEDTRLSLEQERSERDRIIAKS